MKTHTSKGTGSVLHVPETIPNYIFHPAASRGHAAHGWLDSRHSFSFGSYYNPERIQFGALRVLNDDTVAPGAGFGKHPHDNMEIISIPLEGELEHGDNMGNRTIIRQGEVQAMSAGTGVVHSEKNASNSNPVKFLQIWLFPNERNIRPGYDQQQFSEDDFAGKLATVVSPIGTTDGGVQVHQDAWFSLGKLNAGQVVDYHFKRAGNGLYALLLDGEIELNGMKINRRDGLGITDLSDVSINPLTDAHLLLMEVPMA